MARQRKSDFPRYEDGRVKETEYMFVLYPDSTSYNYRSNLEWLENHAAFYVFAEHNNDIDENGEYFNKPHTHVYVKFPNQRFADNLADKLGIGLNQLVFVEPDKEKGIIVYFTHTDQKSKKAKKVEYDWHEFKSNRSLEKYFPQNKDLSECEKIRMLRDFINNFEGVIDGDDVGEYALNNNLWSEWRRSRACLMDTIRKHNHYCSLYSEDVFDYEDFQKLKKMYQKTHGSCVGFRRLDTFNS